MTEPIDPDETRRSLLELAVAEYLEGVDSSHPFDVERWLERHLPIKSDLLAFLETEQAVKENFRGPVEPDGADGASELELTAAFDERFSGRQASRLTPDQSLTRIGSYRLGRFLGSGGMGRVYEGTDQLGNRVAIKVLSSNLIDSPEALLRFKQEGKIASTINHPRCVFVKAADESNGQPYIVMELVTGQTLKDLVIDGQPVSIRQAVQAILDVLDGLEEAHAHGLIHRDIKPGNCYLEANGRVKLGDFGLARSSSDESDLTRTGEFIGTPLFASPEQVKGYPIDHTSDVYSVCATLYFLLTGLPPFPGPSATSVIAKIVSESPEPLRKLNPSVSERLERIVLRGLSRDKKQRFQSVSELKQALKPCLSGQPTFATWGRRIAAYGIDLSLTGLASTLFFLLFSIDSKSVVPSLETYLIFLVPLGLYYLGFEGWGRALPGKRLLRLELNDRQTGDQLTRGKLLIRTLVFLLLGGVTTDLILHASLDPTDLNRWFGWQFLGYSISFLLILSPLLIRPNEGVLLHDWLVGSNVIERERLDYQQQLSGVSRDFSLPLFPNTRFPATVGDFRVQGVVSSTADSAILTARDDRLNRNVWIWMRGADQAEISSNRRLCARSTRLRWLANGKDQHWRWDAFLSFSGAPLKYWSIPESSISWKGCREILQQVAEEFNDGLGDETNVELRSLDQIWLDSRGRVVLVDFNLQEASIRFIQDSSQIKQMHRSVLRETARLLLTGKSRPFSDPPEPIAAGLPLHASRLLESVVNENQSSSEAPISGSFLAELKETERFSTEAKFENRLIGLSTSLFFGAMLIGMMAVLMPAANTAVMDRILDQILSFKTAEYLLKPENESKFLDLAARRAEFPDRNEIESWLHQQGNELPLLEQEYRKRFRSLDSFTRVVWQVGDSEEEFLGQVSKVRFNWDSEQLVANDWKKVGESLPVDWDLFTSLLRSPPDKPARSFLRRGFSKMVLLTNFPVLIWCVWIGITKGGLGMKLSGLLVVDAKGKPISRWHWLGRSLLAASPFFIIQALVVANDLFNPDWLAFSNFGRSLLLFMVLLYAILILAFPRQAPHDVLLGTYLVPR